MLGSNGDLPEDVVIEILSRLPVKSLKRFRCTGKSWYGLIESPCFVPTHLKNYNHNTRLLVSYFDAHDHCPAWSLFHDATLVDLSSQHLSPPMSIPGSQLILGHCDGLVCIHNSRQVTLWNPATRECRPLPKYAINHPQDLYLRKSDLGFGLEISSNDYKLVWIRSFCDEDGFVLPSFSHVAIYTLSTGSWRELDGDRPFHYDLMFNWRSTYLNGVCYWLAVLEQKPVILSFHMGNNMFNDKEVPIPCDPTSAILDLYNDSLSLVVRDVSDTYFDLWVLNGRVWTKQLTVGPIDECSITIGVWTDCLLIIESKNRGWILCNSQEIKELELKIGSKYSSHKVHIYRESLIKIKDGFTPASPTPAISKYHKNKLRKAAKRLDVMYEDENVEENHGQMDEDHLSRKWFKVRGSKHLAFVVEDPCGVRKRKPNKKYSF